MIAYCGLLCDHCPIHLATLEKNKIRKKAMRQSIVELCQEKYGMNLKPEDVTDCDGCRSDSGRIFSGCSKCDIRVCVVKRNHTLCSYCEEFPCEKLVRIFDEDPDARTRLIKTKDLTLK